MLLVNLSSECWKIIDTEPQSDRLPVQLELQRKQETVTGIKIDVEIKLHLS